MIGPILVILSPVWLFGAPIAMGAYLRMDSRWRAGEPIPWWQIAALPFAVIFFVGVMVRAAWIGAAENHRRLTSRPKKLLMKPHPCRCNGGTEPCQLPPVEGVYR